MPVSRKVKYETELDPQFPQWLTSIPGGERARECMQCGTCSSICPLSVYMDITPRRLMAMADAGFKDEVLHSFTIWLCASCYACTVNCPKDIKITDVMYGLKRRAIQEKILPSRRFAIPVLARAFARMVQKSGRTTESRLVLQLALRIGLLHLLSLLPVGWRLMRNGRLSLRKERMRHTDQVKSMLKAAEAL